MGLLNWYRRRRANRRRLRIERNLEKRTDVTEQGCSPTQGYNETNINEKDFGRENLSNDDIFIGKKENQNVYIQEPMETIAQSEEMNLMIHEDVIIEHLAEVTEEGHYEVISDVEGGYSTIDELSGDESDTELFSDCDGVYHHIDDKSSEKSNCSECESFYDDIRELFELPSQSNYYLSIYADSDDENSKIYHMIPLKDTEKSENESDSDQNYSTIEEWDRRSTNTLLSNIAISEDEAGYLIVTDSNSASLEHLENANISQNNNEDFNKEEISITDDSSTDTT